MSDSSDTQRAGARSRARRPGGQRPQSGDGGLQELSADPERLRKRALFLRELSEAKALRDRVQPRRARAARMREQMRMRTFRW
ncbi:hypothetical protein [Streptomyces sp. JJ38]|uniref:hypothetical protein n=1 Tax=Streptomyces sp. JJ38 TaxID=2738128 RepID=UPI001C56554D|nr:hypothetical protein [Streptomyces sp. JJ38]MBW1599995.1 hypothetical protein [Streptomyces sp. JJ38]